MIFLIERRADRRNY